MVTKSLMIVLHVCTFTNMASFVQNWFAFCIHLMFRAFDINAKPFFIKKSGPATHQ